MNSIEIVTEHEETDEFPTPSTPTHSSGSLFPPYVSPTLLGIQQDRRPPNFTICQSCPASVWFASPQAVKCYCRIMHAEVWSTEDPRVLEACDGQAMAEAQRQAQLMKALKG